MLKAITTKINVSNIFLSLAAATTAVSMWTSYKGISSAYDEVSAIVGSLVIGIALFTATHALLTNKDKRVKVAAAVLFAIFFIASGETIEMGAQHKAAQLAKKDNALLRSDELAKLKLQHEERETLKADLRSQIAALEASNAADRVEAKRLKDDIRRQIADLRRANSSDQEQVEIYQDQADRQRKPQTNSANARNAIAAIDKRLTEIDKLTKKIGTVSTSLDKDIKLRETQINGLRTKLISQSHEVGSTTTPTTSEVEQLENFRLFSYRYDFSTLVFMLFMSWHRKDEDEDESEVIELASADDVDNSDFDASPLASPVITPEEHAIFMPNNSDNNVMSLDDICNVPQDNVQPTAEITESEKAANSTPLMTREEFKDALIKRRIETNDDGFITAAIAQKLCADINDPRPAKKFFQQCCEEEILEFVDREGRGRFFRYSSVVPGQTKIKLRAV